LKSLKRHPEPLTGYEHNKKPLKYILTAIEGEEINFYLFCVSNQVQLLVREEKAGPQGSSLQAVWHAD